MDIQADDDMFFHLPDELVLHVFKFLPTVDVVRCESVARRWRRLASDNLLWKYLYMRYVEKRYLKLQRRGGSLYTRRPWRVSVDAWLWKDAYQAQFNWHGGSYQLRQVVTPDSVADLCVNGTIVTTTSRWDDALHVWNISRTPPKDACKAGSVGSSSGSGSGGDELTEYQRRVMQTMVLEEAAATEIAANGSEALDELVRPTYAFDEFDECHVQSMLTLTGSRSRFQWLLFFPFRYGSLVAGISRSRLRVWNMETGELVHSLMSPMGWDPNRVAFSNTKLLASNLSGDTLVVYDLETGEPENVLAESHTAVAVSDEYFVMLSPTKITVYMLATYELLRSAPRMGGLLIEFDDERIVTGGREGSVMIHDMETLDHVVLSHTGQSITGLAFDDVRLVTGNATGLLSVWSLEAGYPCMFNIQLDLGLVRHITFDDMKIVVTGDVSKIVVVDFTPERHATTEDDAAGASGALSTRSSHSSR